MPSYSLETVFVSHDTVQTPVARDRGGGGVTVSRKSRRVPAPAVEAGLPPCVFQPPGRKRLRDVVPPLAAMCLAKALGIKEASKNGQLAVSAVIKNTFPGQELKFKIFATSVFLCLNYYY